ncbi:DUF1642 domain-containing protein [Streptococcus lutetiensis]|uniref:DUF1642 domain-containing protein n=1 Tax=Streptococcus lutetiensis TaxID=150055 RepID=UPI001BDA4F1A|nr:DUF1642 domain-containing protein [Streptococcus lutetiensis]MBT0938529.1 DUF1642 domain-containing protein [Streptococcus lutetiensis]
MNKQELIDKLKKQLTAPSEIDDTDFNKFYDLAINYAIYLAEQLDEPKRPVVPRYVADFYESIKDDLEDGVYEICVQLYNCDLDGRINFWFGCNDNKPIETLVKMKLYGYEVEKEKLYTVEIPNPNGFIRLVLCKDCDGKLFVATFSGGDCWENFGKCKITESEIKKNFDWAWQFAKEVEDDTKI